MRVPPVRCKLLEWDGLAIQSYGLFFLISGTLLVREDQAYSFTGRGRPSQE